MNKQLTLIEMTKIHAGNNDRTEFNQIKLHELSQSIEKSGLAQPITLRAMPNDTYEIVAGERRFRACQLLGWETIPAIVDELTDEQVAAIMLAENTARADLDPIEEAKAFSTRINALEWSVEDCAAKAGVSTVYIHFRLKLLRLRPDLQHLVRHGHLQLGYAQILADANLDNNRQLFALNALRDNASPTPKWFRQEVNRLAEAQRQTSMFDDTPLLTNPVAPVQSIAATITPPLPGKVSPPKSGSTVSEILKEQITFWTQAASQWDALGKCFKRNECRAAASALSTALSAIS